MSLTQGAQPARAGPLCSALSRLKLGNGARIRAELLAHRGEVAVQLAKEVLALHLCGPVGVTADVVSLQVGGDVVEQGVYTGGEPVVLVFRLVADDGTVLAAKEIEVTTP